MPVSKEEVAADLEAAHAALIAEDKALAAARAAIQNADPLPGDAIAQIQLVDKERLELGKRIRENRNLYIQARENEPDLQRLLAALREARKGAQADAARIRKVKTDAGKVVDVLEKAASEAPQLRKKINDALAKVDAFLK